VRVERRRAVLTLGSITLPQLGRLLAAWREREPEWIVTSIDATPLQISDKPERGGGVQVAPGGDIPARVVIAIERWSVRQPRKTTPVEKAAPLLRPSSSSPRTPSNTPPSPPPRAGASR
jgi:hypothetical protein